MRTAIIIALAGLLPLLPLQAQDPTTEPSPEAAKAIDDALNELENAIKSRVPNDQAHFVKVLAEKWKDASPKQRSESHKLVMKNLRSRERDVREATIMALGQMDGGKKDKDAKLSTRILMAETKQKSMKEDLPLFVKCLDSIGRLKTDRGAEDLVKFLNHKDNEVIAGSLDAMKHYRESDFALRKELVKEILKIYQSVFGQSRDPNNNTAQAKLKAIELQAESALATLTNKADVKGANKWRDWWNNEGKKASKDW